MIQLIKYIFSRLYYFYDKVLGIRHNTFLYPSVLMGFLLAFNVLVVLSFILQIFDTSFFGILPTIRVGVVLSVLFYMKMGSHYKSILKEVESYENSKRSKLRISSIIYTSVSMLLFFGFYWLG